MKYQYDLFDHEYNDYINSNTQPELPALLMPPVYSQWDRYDEGDWTDCYNCF